MQDKKVQLHDDIDSFTEGLRYFLLNSVGIPLPQGEGGIHMIGNWTKYEMKFKKRMRKITFRWKKRMDKIIRKYNLKDSVRFIRMKASRTILRRR